MLNIVVLNLDRSPERLEAFHRHNPRHADIRRFSALEGAKLDRAQLVADGLLEEGFDYRNGALGNALSNVALWREAVERQCCVTVLEDDAVLCGNFRQEALRLIAGLPEGWDYVQWGYNFDTTLTYAMLPGLSGCKAVFNQEGLQRNIDKWHRYRVPSVLFRVVCSLGIPGYTLSPKGAERFLAACLPLRQATHFNPGLGRTYDHRSIDFMFNTLHATHATYVAVPPLIVTANDAATSTVARGT